MQAGIVLVLPPYLYGEDIGLPQRWLQQSSCPRQRLILYREYRLNDIPQQTVPVETVSQLAEVKVIDFENAPLPDVIKRIESVYGVKVEDVPASPEGYVLSLHYEGTPTDLISVINDILETKMTVTEK